MNNRTAAKRRELFEELVNEVDFAEGGLKKAFELLDKIEGKKNLYTEPVRKPIISGGKVLLTDEDEAMAFEKQYN